MNLWNISRVIPFEFYFNRDICVHYERTKQWAIVIREQYWKDHRRTQRHMCTYTHTLPSIESRPSHRQWEEIKSHYCCFAHTMCSNIVEITLDTRLYSIILCLIVIASANYNTVSQLVIVMFSTKRTAKSFANLYNDSNEWVNSNNNSFSISHKIKSPRSMKI